MTRVKLPRLLDANMAEAARVQPSALSLTLSLRNVCTAQMTLQDGGPSVGMHAWFEIFTKRGSAGLFRVTDMTHTSRFETAYTLRHAIDTLSDDVWPAQTDYSGTVAGFLAALLAKQTTARWQLGTCQDTAAWKRGDINYDRLSDLLEEIATDREDYYFTYDFSTTPWTLNFLALQQDVSSEFRLSRNATNARINRNDGDMCNRLYLSVSSRSSVSEMPSSETTVTVYNNTASQAVYGVIVKTADVDTADVADPQAWAADFLNRRAEPGVQITFDGLELAALTGETWDEADRGRKARVVLADMGEIVTERIECVNYPNVLGEPERVTVEMANRLSAYTSGIASMGALGGITGQIAEIGKTASRAGSAARSAGRGMATADELKYWATIIRDTDLENLYETGIEIGPQGARIYSVTQGLLSEYAEIVVHSGQISTIVTKSGINSLGENETLYGMIQVNAGNIALVVSDGSIRAASIVLAINESGSSVEINADKIVLNGTTKVSDLLTGVATASQLRATNVTAGTLNAGSTSMGVLTLNPNAYLDASSNGCDIYVNEGDLFVGTFAASWKSKTFTTYSLSATRNFRFVENGVEYYLSGQIVTGTGSTTIYYLGRN